MMMVVIWVNEMNVAKYEDQSWTSDKEAEMWWKSMQNVVRCGEDVMDQKERRNPGIKKDGW